MPSMPDRDGLSAATPGFVSGYPVLVVHREPLAQRAVNGYDLLAVNLHRTPERSPPANASKPMKLWARAISTISLRPVRTPAGVDRAEILRAVCHQVGAHLDVSAEQVGGIHLSGGVPL